MTGSGSPCGACKFLRRKCVRGCIFAPYFSHEQGAANFAGIHKVFGASNVSKLLGHLPAADRAEAAVTISYEAQARLQDPIYGCVSHIFALQHQVVNLQAQLASLKEQAAHTMMTKSSANPNANPKTEPDFYSPNQNFLDIQSWVQSQGSALPQFDSNYFGNFGPYCASGPIMDCDPNPNPNPNPSGNYESKSCFPEDNASFGSMESLEMQYSNDRQWPFQDEAEDNQSAAFGYINNYS